jgi:acyl-CoA hydrolase
MTAPTPAPSAAGQQEMDSIITASTTTTAEPASDDRLTLRFLTAPQDMDHTGKHVEAGRVLEWIDRAGYACAVAWSTSYCVTAYVGNVHYDGAIGPGDVVEVDAKVIHTGKSSVHVLVSVHARPLQESKFIRAMHCILVLVTVDEHGKPHRVRPWTPWSLEDSARQQLALERIPVRTRIKEAMLAEQYSDEGTAP